MIRRTAVNNPIAGSNFDKPGFVTAFALELEPSSWLLRSDKSFLSWAFDNAIGGLPSSASETWLAAEKPLYRFEFGSEFILPLG